MKVDPGNSLGNDLYQNGVYLQPKKQAIDPAESSKSPVLVWLIFELMPVDPPTSHFDNSTAKPPTPKVYHQRCFQRLLLSKNLLPTNIDHIQWNRALISALDWTRY